MRETLNRPDASAAGQGRVFSGAELQTIAFPLGGIGTGTVSLGGRGNLQDWEIFNRPAKGWGLPCTFFAAWAQAHGSKATARVLERSLLPPYVEARGLRPVRTAGLPRLREARFTGGYPIAHIEFTDPDFPLHVRLEAFNPMVPLDAETSGLPAAIFVWHLENRGPETVDTTVAFSMANAAGHDGLTSLEHEEEAIWLQPSGPAFGGNVNRWIDEGEIRGLNLSGSQVSSTALGSGTLAVATPWASTTFLEHWERAGWYDPLESFWEDFRADGRLPDESTADPSPDGRSDIGTLGLCATVQPGESVALPFVVAWHFPNLTNYWDAGSPAHGAPLGNWYATRYADAWSVARDIVGRLSDLTDRTHAFRDTLFASTLPEAVLDAVSSQMSIVRTATCIRTSDGVFHGFEGCNDHAGSCPMDCTHVWNYEQTLAHLFPDLERTMRDTDFLISTRPSGRMAFRSILPVSLNHLWEYMPAADGQLGCVLKLFREWQLSGDTEWLRVLWPSTKRAIEWSWEPGSWDPDRDGVMEGEQHTTYDIEFFGPNTMTGTIYLGALKAAARMAAALDDCEAAERYEELYQAGTTKLDRLLWNGEYYRQLVPDTVQVESEGRPDWSPSPLPTGESELRYQYGDGCLSDQLLGQWLCHVVGLGYVLPEAHVKRAIEAVFRHNWQPDLSRHESCQRTYALNDEAGLLLCTWPRGGRPTYPFPYADEVWTGVEYQVAAHLIYEGFIDEGLLVVEAVRARHDGVRRNPWNEFECGHHYARAMASWSVFLALTGYGFDAIGQTLRFAPARPRDGFCCFFSTASAWGQYAYRFDGSTHRHTLRVVEGELTLQTLEVAAGPMDASVRVIDVGGRTLRTGDELAAHVLQDDGSCETHVYAAATQA